MDSIDKINCEQMVMVKVIPYIKGTDSSRLCRCCRFGFGLHRSGLILDWRWWFLYIIFQ
jgi:hypothetical protein